MAKEQHWFLSWLFSTDSFSYFFQFFSYAKTVYVFVITSVFLLHVGLTLLCAFILFLSTPCSDGAWLQPGIWLKKGSFLLFWISCFGRLPGEGVGWLHHSPLSRTGLTTLMWPCSAPLLCPTMGLFLHCVVWHLMSPSIISPFNRASFLVSHQI